MRGAFKMLGVGWGFILVGAGSAKADYQRDLWLQEEIETAIKTGDLVVASVLSGNRNFEGRVHPNVKANYLASPPLCVAYAIAGSVAIDLATEPLAHTKDGKPVYLKDLWPTWKEVQDVKSQCLSPDQFRKQYGNVFTGNEMWNKVPVSKSDSYAWNDKSSYIHKPPFFDGMSATPTAPKAIMTELCRF